MATPKVKVRFEIEGEGTAKQALRNTATEAETAADRIDRRMKSLGNTLKALGIGTLIYQGLAFAVRATIDAERSTAALEARVRSLGANAAASVPQIQKLAESLQAVTTFDDEAIQDAATALLKFTNIDPGKFEDALTAALDVSAGEMKDLAQAAEIVGKALNDPAAAMRTLRELGIDLTDSQQQLIDRLLETGQTAAAQQIILDELAARYEGAAVAARDTFGGALQALRNSLGNLVEGGPDTLTGARDAVESLTKALNDPETKAGADTIISAMAEIVEWGVIWAETYAKAGRVIGATFGYIAQQASHTIEMNKAALSGDLQGWMDARAGLMREEGVYAGQLGDILLQKERKFKWNDPPPLKPNTGLVMRSGESQTIHGGDLFGTDPNAGGGSAHAAERAAAAAAKRAAAEVARALKEQQAAAEDYRNAMLDLEATVGGDLTEATRRYEVELENLNKLAAEGKVGAEDQARAQAALLALHEKETAEIRQRQDPAAQLIADMQFELELLGMTNAEREVAINLREMEGKATAAQIEQMRGLIQAREEMARVTGEMDQWRSEFRGIFEDVVNGSKSGIDALKDLGDAFAEQLIRMATEWATAQLFGQPGQSGGGLFGGLLSAIFGMVGGGGGGASGGSGFGIPLPGSGTHPGFAEGGNPPVGSPYWVGERGRELRIDRTPGTIIPMHKLGGNRTNNISISVPGGTTRETANHIAAKVLQAIRLAERD